MSYILVRFQSSEDPMDIAARLAQVVPAFVALGDWHVHRMEAARTAANAARTSGMRVEYADRVVQSVLDDHDIHGRAAHVRLTLNRGDVMEGQIRGSGMLLTCALTDSATLRLDSNISALCDALSTSAVVDTIEIE